MPLPFSRGFAGRMALTSRADAWMDKLTSRFSLENAAFPRRGLIIGICVVPWLQEGIWSYSEEAEYGQIQTTPLLRYV